MNPIKIAAALSSFRAVFPSLEFEAEGFAAPSGVSDQPMSDQETRAGATNRANWLKHASPTADFWVGIEGGMEPIEDEWFASAWMVVLSSSGHTGEGKSGLFPIPPEVKRLVLSGMELGHANDKVFGEHNSKQAGGAVGSLTNGLVSRRGLYEHALVLALIPLSKPELFAVRETG